ncbi:MAG: cytidine deaminase [Anaerolineae bacterium]|nr:cytidine deaminase [Anaerolineae bacterium]
MTDELDIQGLIASAIDASKNAYVPYSEYHVGAALLAPDGTVFTGCNVENASYPATICGERTALVKAVSEGQRAFTAIAVATKNGGSPCGVCRQMLFEFAPDLRVICCDFDGNITIDESLRNMLLYGFGPSDLPKPE